MHKSPARTVMASFQPHIEVLGAPTLKSARQECKDETKNNLAKTPSDTQQITILNAKVANMAPPGGYGYPPPVIPNTLAKRRGLHQAKTVGSTTSIC